MLYQSQPGGSWCWFIGLVDVYCSTTHDSVLSPWVRCEWWWWFSLTSLRVAIEYIDGKWFCVHIGCVKYRDIVYLTMSCRYYQDGKTLVFWKAARLWIDYFVQSILIAKFDHCEQSYFRQRTGYMAVQAMHGHGGKVIEWSKYGSTWPYYADIGGCNCRPRIVLQSSLPLTITRLEIHEYSTSTLLLPDTFIWICHS